MWLGGVGYGRPRPKNPLRPVAIAHTHTHPMAISAAKQAADGKQAVGEVDQSQRPGPNNSQPTTHPTAPTIRMAAAAGAPEASIDTDTSKNSLDMDSLWLTI